MLLKLLFFPILFLSCAERSTDILTVSQLGFQQTNEQVNDTISITAVGDIMMGTAFPSVSNLPSEDGIYSFKEALPYLKGDIVFGNLEGCLLDEGFSQKCKDTLGNNCYAFRMPERYAGIIKDAGFNLLSIANNHIGDFEQEGKDRTSAILDSININYAGLLTHPYSIFEIGGIKYGFCAFAPNKGTVPLNKITEGRSLVQNLKKKVDIVIVSFHGGAEGAKYERITRENEIFLKENRGNPYAFAHAMIDAGADIVLGHGPHVVRAVEVYKNKLIAYSLGNFCTYGMFNLKGPNGIAPLLQIKLNGKGDFLYADIISMKQTRDNGLEMDDTHAAFEKIKVLTAMDFPENDLEFAEGRISIKKDKEE